MPNQDVNAQNPAVLADSSQTNNVLGAPWPSSAVRLADGAVQIGGVDLRALAQQHGTAAYVLDEADVRARARALRTSFTAAFSQVGAEVDIYYAGKAFLSVAVARWVHEEGLSVDTATGGELGVALRAGVPGPRIGLHGNNKSAAEITRALTAGVGRLVIDSVAEVDQVADLAAELGVRAQVMVRVTTGVHAGGHEYIATSHEDQKFGLSVVGGLTSPAMVALQRVLHRPELQLVGIHSHIGSQILDPAGFIAALRVVLQLRALLAQSTGVVVPEIDLGGGFGIAYLPGETDLEPQQIAAALAAAAAEVTTELGVSMPRFSFEPGRAIIGPPGVTVYTVGTVKPVQLADGEVRTYVSVDGGMSDNIRPALYGAAYHAILANRVSTAAPVTARVVGKHCESGDIVVRDVLLPGDVTAGDLLVVAATGAYGRAMGSNYNMVPRPPVVGVRDGVSRELIRRETEQDLLALDQG